jgi:hypothetical protein
VTALDLVDLVVDPAARKARVDGLRREIKAVGARVRADIRNGAAFRRFTNEEQRDEVGQCLTKTEQEMRIIDGVEPTSQDLSKLLARLKGCAAPVYKRIEENETFCRMIQKFRTRFAKARQFVDTERTSCDSAHLPELLRFDTVIDNVEGWFNATVNGIIDIVPSEPLPVKPGLLVQHFTDFRREFNTVKGYIRPSKIPIRTPSRVPLPESMFSDL